MANAMARESSRLAITSAGIDHSSTKRRFTLVMRPSVSTTRMPSAVDSRVAASTEFADSSACSAALRSVMSWLETTSALTVGSSSRFLIVTAMGIVPPSRRWKSRSTVMVGTPEPDVGARTNAIASASRERSQTSTISPRWRPSIPSWSWPSIRLSADVDASTMPSPPINIVRIDALCMSDRNRASSSWATSHRRRSVRSRMLNTSRSPSGAPTISTRRQPSWARSRSSRGVPTSLSCTLDSESTAICRSSGWMRSNPFSPRPSANEMPNSRSAARFAHRAVAIESTTRIPSGRPAATAARVPASVPGPRRSTRVSDCCGAIV